LNGQITNPADALVRRTLMQIVFLLATLAVVVFPRTKFTGWRCSGSARACCRQTAVTADSQASGQRRHGPMSTGHRRPDMTGRGRVRLTEDISSARSHAGAVCGVTPAPAEIVAGGRNTDVRSVLRNGAAIDSLRRSHHPLPWWNTPSGGENHVSDADGRSVYNGADADEMFRLYTDAVQADAEVAARRVADHPRRRDRRSLRAWPADVASRVRGLLHRR
jgi:hypothetical protein